MINLTWQKVMAVIIDNQAARHTVKEISEKTQLQYRQVLEALKALEYRNLIVVYPTSATKSWETRTKAQISSNGREILRILNVD